MYLFNYRAVSELAEALRDSDDIKKERNETQKENKDLRERLENVEKTLRMKSQLHRSANGHSHRFVFCLHFTFKIHFFLFTNFLFCFHEFFFVYTAMTQPLIQICKNGKQKPSTWIWQV